MIDGFILLHRRLMAWEWYTDTNTKALFLHCLMKANWKPKSWRGKVIERGCFLTSTDILAKETGLTVRNVRTALKNLVSTNELTIKTSRQGTVIKVNNLNLYQPESGKATNELTRETTNETTNELTNKRQTSDKQVTSTNKDNKDNKDKNKNIALDFSKWPEMPSDEIFRDWKALRKKQKADISQTVVNRFAVELSKACDYGFSVDQCLTQAIVKGWRGFECEWMKNSNVVPITKARKASGYQMQPFPGIGGE